MSQDWKALLENLKQDYSKYTDESHEVWSILFNRQCELLLGKATDDYIEGIDKVDFKPDRIPDFNRVEKLMNGFTNWGIQAVPGIVPDDVFFKLLAAKRFPSTTWIRTKSQLDYLEEPDMFHDVFGHMPLLTQQSYCDFLVGLSEIALDYIGNAEAIELLTRIYWYTIEFGLIHQKGQLRIYGAGILSSIGETPYSLSNEVPKYDFSVSKIMETPYIKEKFQVLYYVIESYDQLYASLPEVRVELEKMLALQAKA